MGVRCPCRAFVVHRPGHRDPRGRAAGRRVTAHLAGWGTIALRSRSNPALTCIGDFSATEALGDAGQLKCSDGASATFEFQRLGLRRGYGGGSSNRGALSFTYGLSADESAPYLKLPAGKALSEDGSNLRLVAAAPYPLR